MVIRSVPDVTPRDADTPGAETESTPRVHRNVILVGAHELKKADLMGKSDPYAVVYLDDEKVEQTPHVPKTLNPVWNAVIGIHVPDMGATLRVEIYDYDENSGHDFLGQVELSLGR